MKTSKFAFEIKWPLSLNHTFGVGVDETELAAETTGTLLEAEDGGGIGGKGPVMAAEPAIMEAGGAVEAMEAAEAMEADLGNAPSTADVPAIKEGEVPEDNEGVPNDVVTPAVEVDVLNGSPGAPMGAIPGKPGGFPPPRPANKELGPPIFGFSFLSCKKRES